MCFEYFVKDIKNLQNWDKKLDDWSKYTLEKDFGRGFIYSKDDCIWSQYNFSRLDRTIHYTFENKESKELFTTNNFAEFGRKIDKEKLVNSHMKKLIDGRLLSLGGWTLVKIEDKENKGVDQIKELIDGLKTSPMSRRHLLSAWNPTTLNDMALNACHVLVQFNCRPLKTEEKIKWVLDGKTKTPIELENLAITEAAHDPSETPQYYLDCQMYQRSCDTFLGLGYNIASYALLTHILCKVCNMVPGDYIHSFGDVHIYDNHMAQIDEQLLRDVRVLPNLKFSDWFENSIKENHPEIDLNTWIDSLSIKDFIVENYNPHPTIKGKLSTGLQ